MEATTFDFDLFDALVNYFTPMQDDSKSTDVVEVNLAPSRNFEGFQGACMDIGATKSVVGKAQAKAYYHFIGILLVISSNTNRMLKFGTDRQKSIGKAKFRVLLEEKGHILIEVDIVKIDVPLLIGLDIMDKHHLYVNTVQNLLVCEKPEWNILVVRKRGHIYYEWDYDVMCTDADLKKIHRHFYHPRPERIFSLMKRSKDPNATVETMQSLEKITSSCDTCQRLASQPRPISRCSTFREHCVQPGRIPRSHVLRWDTSPTRNMQRHTVQRRNIPRRREVLRRLGSLLKELGNTVYRILYSSSC